jgi:hypothetical protein
MPSSPEPRRIPVKTPEKVEAKPESKPAGFFNTLPGLLTAVGGLVAAIATLLTALNAVGMLGRPTATPAPSATPTWTLTIAPTTTLTPAPLATVAPTKAEARPTLAPTARPTSASGLLFEDDFSDPKSGWGTRTVPNYEVGYVDGEYGIVVHKTQQEAWAVAPQLSLDNFSVQVDARRVSGPEDNDFGLLVRYQEDSDDFYALTISSDGFFSAQLRQGEAWEELVKWTESPAIQKGEKAINRLKVECRGAEMRFYANGALLITLQDSTLSGGTLGLMAGTFDIGDVAIRFDNFRVQALH